MRNQGCSDISVHRDTPNPPASAFILYFIEASRPKRAENENENHRFQLLRRLLTTLERPVNDLSSPGVFVLQEPSSLEVFGENEFTVVFMSSQSFYQDVRQG